MFAIQTVINQVKSYGLKDKVITNQFYNYHFFFKIFWFVARTGSDVVNINSKKFYAVSDNNILIRNQSKFIINNW